MGASKNEVIRMGEAEENLPQTTKGELNKISIFDKVKQIEKAVLNGNINPLEAFVYLKFMEEVAKKAREKILDEGIKEAMKYPEKEFKEYGCKIQLRGSAGRWDYSENQRIQAMKDAIKEEEKDAQRAYHCFQKGETIVNEDGEVIKPASYTPGKDTLAITF